MTRLTGPSASRAQRHASDVPQLSVAVGYARWAATYDLAPNALLAREERYLAPTLPDLSGKAVLDVACGTGRWLWKLLALGAHSAVGLDLSNSMLRVAGKKPMLRGRVTEATCLRMPFRDSAFDLVICSFVAGHIRRRRAMFRELHRVMKVGGAAVVTDLHPEAYASGWRTGFRDQFGAAQIDTKASSSDTLLDTAFATGFECRSFATLCVEEEEKPIFVAMNKLQLFADVVGKPAILALELNRCH